MNIKLTELNKSYQFARAEYLNFVEEENFDIPVKVFDEKRQHLHNAAFVALKELNVEYMKVFKKPFVSKDEIQHEGKELVYRIKGMPVQNTRKTRYKK